MACRAAFFRELEYQIEEAIGKSYGEKVSIATDKKAGKALWK